MFMYYCGQKGSKFGESQTAAKVLRSRENHVENKNFLGGHAPKPPYKRAAARGTCRRHVQGDHFLYYIIFRFFFVTQYHAGNMKCI